MVFLFLLLSLILIAVILFFSRIRIEIINFKFSSQLQKHINKDYEIIIKLCVLGLFPILKIKVTKTKLEKMKVKEKIEKINFTELERKIPLNKETFETIKKLDIVIKNINLYIDIGTENAGLTSIIVPAISTIIAIILHKKIKKFENQSFIMNPIYQNQNLVNLSVSGIFEVKLRHIINIIYILNRKEKKGVKKYERTSNRGSYDYSYE